MRVTRLDIMSVDTPHTAESILYILYDVPAKDQIDRDLPCHIATLEWASGSVQISGDGLHSPSPSGTGRGRPVVGSDDARTAGRSLRIAASQSRRAGGGFRGGLSRTVTV
jgi:hypothetical protein